MSQDIPGRQEVSKVIEYLISGKLDRVSASDWALKYVLDVDYKINDKVVWQVLQSLGAVDLVSTDRPYLYNEVDFQIWLKELQEKS